MTREEDYMASRELSPSTEKATPKSAATDLGVAERKFVLVSLKHTGKRDAYLTFWRPNRAGYCWPLSWAGRYSESDARYLSDDHPGEETFAVPEALALELSEKPRAGVIDGDSGPVVRRRWAAALRAAALSPPSKIAGEG